MSSSSSPKRKGPVPNKQVRVYTVLLEEPLAEWGKQQPGGLSDLLRRLLAAEWRRQSRRNR